MCEITEKFFQEGHQAGFIEGRQEGRIEGRQEGFMEGREEERLKAIRNIMDSMDCSANRAMELLKIPEKERTVYFETLKQ